MSVDPREATAHRFRRGRQSVDVLTDDVVDVLVADHASPRAVGRLRGRQPVRIDGGTQALRRSVTATVVIDDDRPTVLSTPGVFGALVLKAAAFVADSRDPHRHAADATVLLACLEDPYEAVQGFTGSDRSRLRRLAAGLPDDAPAWRLLPADRARDARAALRVLVASP